MNKVLFSSERMDWETPNELFLELNKEFSFTLDAASSHENAKCERHYTEKEDGLSQNWGVKLYGATLRMEKSFQSGSRNAQRKERKRILQLSC